MKKFSKQLFLSLLPVLWLSNAGIAIADVRNIEFDFGRGTGFIIASVLLIVVIIILTWAIHFIEWLSKDRNENNGADAECNNDDQAK